MSSILSRSVLRQVLEKAVSYGADFAEVYAEHTKSNRMTMVDGKVETIMDNFLSGAGIRVFKGLKSAYASTSDLSLPSLLKCAENAAASLSNTPASREILLTERLFGDVHPIRIVPDTAPNARKAEILRTAYTSAKSYHESISQVETALIDVDHEILIANTDGLLTGDRQIRTRLFTQAVASKNGENQKGLVTFDRKIKKDAFYLYKAYWSKQPFVHTCGSRYVDRTEDVTEVRVYSNLPEVSLYKDGHLVETKKGDKVFVFNVPITGKHSIEARAGAYSSVILVNKATEPNPAYAMSNRQVVNNWFDGELDETCWSVKDNMAAAMADAKVGPVLKAITDKAAAARGDVAAAVKDNPALVAMMERAMQRMTVESMLKQAGADAESIRQLNRVLQGIKKDV